MEKRSESKTRISNWTATLDLETTHKPDLTEIVDSLMFREDDSDSSSATTATHDIDFDDVDYHEVTLNYVTVALTVSNFNQGEVKWVKVIEGTDNSYSWSGITDISFSVPSLPSIWMLFNKDSNIYAVPMSEGVTAATDAQQQSGASSTLVSTPESVKYVTRHGYKSLANAETYNVSDGVGSIELPTGVIGGTINLPTAADFTGHKILIYSTGGYGIEVGSTETGLDIFPYTVDYKAEYISNGTTWTRLTYEAMT